MSSALRKGGIKAKTRSASVPRVKDAEAKGNITSAQLIGSVPQVEDAQASSSLASTAIENVTTSSNQQEEKKEIRSSTLPPLLADMPAAGAGDKVPLVPSTPPKALPSSSTATSVKSGAISTPLPDNSLFLSPPSVCALKRDYLYEKKFLKFCPECSYAISNHVMDPTKVQGTIAAHQDALKAKPPSIFTSSPPEVNKAWKGRTAEEQVRYLERKAEKKALRRQQRKAVRSSAAGSSLSYPRKENFSLSLQPEKKLSFDDDPSASSQEEDTSSSSDSDSSNGDSSVQYLGAGRSNPTPKEYHREPRHQDQSAAVKYVVDKYQQWDHNKLLPSVTLQKIFLLFNRKCQTLDARYASQTWPTVACADLFKSDSAQQWIATNLGLKNVPWNDAQLVLIKRYGGRSTEHLLEIEWLNYKQGNKDLTTYIDGFEDLIQRRGYDMEDPGINRNVTEQFMQKLDEKIMMEFIRHPTLGRMIDSFRYEYEYVKGQVLRLNELNITIDVMKGSVKPHGHASHTASSGSSSSAPSSSSKKQHCDTHGTCSHSTANCKNPGKGSAAPKGILKKGNQSGPNLTQTQMTDFVTSSPSPTSTPSLQRSAQPRANPQRSPSSSSPTSAPLHCNHCNKPGHTEARCHQLHPELFAEWKAAKERREAGATSARAVQSSSSSPATQPGEAKEVSSSQERKQNRIQQEGFDYSLDQVRVASIRFLEQALAGEGNDPRVQVILPSGFPTALSNSTLPLASPVPQEYKSLLDQSTRRIEAYPDSGCSNAQINHALVEELSIPFTAAGPSDLLRLANGSTTPLIGRTCLMPIRLLFIEPNGSTQTPVVDIMWRFDIMDLYTGKPSSPHAPAKGAAQEIYFGKDLMVAVTRIICNQSGDAGVGKFTKFLLSSDISPTLVGAVRSAPSLPSIPVTLLDGSGQETKEPEQQLDPAMEFNILRDFVAPLSVDLDDGDNMGKEKRTTITKNIMECQRVKDAIQRNQDIPRTSFCNHPDSKIPLRLKPGVHMKQIFSKQYGIPEWKWKLMDAIIQVWIKEKRVTDAPPLCEVNNPMLGVAKMEGGIAVDGKIRVCLDTRKLNANLDLNDVFRIQHIAENHLKLANKLYYGEIDVEQCFTQFELEELSRVLTAFSWGNRQLMFIGAPFGISFFPNWVHRFLSLHVTEHLRQLHAIMDSLVSFIDNFTFGADTEDEHKEQLILLLDCCTKLNLRVKCGEGDIKVGYSRIRVLGHIVSKTGLLPDNRKVDVLRLWPLPTSGKEMQSLLGTANFIRQYIRHFADLTSCLEKVKNDLKIIWTPIMLRHFNLLKDAMVRAPFLRYPDYSRPFYIATDASQLGIGGVLYQPSEGDNEDITANNIVGIASKIISGSQLNYSTFKRELLAVIFCLNHFKRYIWGRVDTVVYTDHKPLKYMFECPNPSVTLQSWMDILLEHCIEIRYRPGVANVLPDALSRVYADRYVDRNWGVPNGITWNIRPEDLDKGDSSYDINVERTSSSLEEKENKTSANSSQSSSLKYTKKKKHKSSISTFNSFSLLDDDKKSSKEGITAAVTRSASVPVPAASLASPSPSVKVARAKHSAKSKMSKTIPSPIITANLDEVIEGLTSLTSTDNKDTGVTESTVKECLKRGKTIIPPADREKLILTEHAKGHFGRDQVYAKLYEAGHWWPNMRNDIEKATASCEQCIRHVVKRRGFKPAEYITAPGPWHHIQMDCQTNLPRAYDGSTTILSIVDVFSGFCLLFPLKDHTAKSIAEKLWYTFSIFGFPAIIQSDNGTEFCNETVKELIALCAIDFRHITAYNPRCDGKVERTFGIITPVMSKLMEGATIYWPLFLPLVQLYINRRISSLTNSTPFSLLFNREAVLPGEFPHSPDVTSPPFSQESLQEWQDFQAKVRDIIFPSLNERVRQRKEEMIKAVDKKHQILDKEAIKAGSAVSLLNPSILLGNPLPKHAEKYQGVYTVVRVDRNGNLLLKDRAGQAMKRHVPPDQVKSLPNQSLDQESKDTYEVERVLKHKGEPGHFEYYVKWKGYGENHNTWEPAQHFHSTECIREYWKRRDEASLLSIQKEEEITKQLAKVM